MHSLPPHLIQIHDEAVFSQRHLVLAKIARLLGCVPKGLVIAPPTEEIVEILKGLKVENISQFESKQKTFKEYLGQLDSVKKIQQELMKSDLNPEIIWEKIVAAWIEEIKSHLLRFNLIELKHFYLESFATFEFNDYSGRGECFFDRITHQVVIVDSQNVLNETQRSKLDQIVKKLSHALLTPYIFEWALDNNHLWIIDLKPQTEHKTQTRQTVPMNLDGPTIPRKRSRALKLFCTLSTKLNFEDNADGYIIDQHNFHSNHDELTVLLEACSSLQNTPFIYNIHVDKQDQLIQKVENVLFIRNNKRLTNLNVCLCEFYTPEALFEAKRTLASLGLTRKGNLNFWVRFSTPESLINIDAYFEAGFDGVIVDLDQLTVNIFGGKKPEDILNPTVSKTLIKLLETPVKFLHKNEIPIIFSGQSAFEESMLEFVISKGIWGLQTSVWAHSLMDSHISMKEFLHLK